MPEMQLSVVAIPEKPDPDEYLKVWGRGFSRIKPLHGRETIFAFKSRYLKQKNLENEKDKIEYLEAVLSELSKVVSPIRTRLCI